MTYDVIGTIHKPTGIILTDNEGNEYPQMESIEGYHVNVLDLNEDETELVTAYMVEVTAPVRKFAGREDTVHLKFINRDEWLSLEIEKIEEI